MPFSLSLYKRVNTTEHRDRQAAGVMVALMPRELTAGHQESKEKEGKAELVGIPGVSFAQVSKGDLGPHHHLHTPLHTHRFSQATKQESGDQTAPSLTSHIQEASGSVDATL